MAVYIRLDDAVRARLRGDAGSSASSGSEHEASACLSGLVQAFLETEGAAAGEDGAGPASKGGEGYDSDDGDGPERAAAAAESVRELLDPPVEEDPFRVRLAAAVAAAMEAEPALRRYGAAFRRAVARRLRAAGYDAGVCKSRWEASGGITAGTYEYVDVVAPAARGQKSRYIVDADFRAGLEVARATAEYAVVVAAVPASVVVAREEAVGRAVRVAADAARRSLRSHGLHVPPWRKTRYMLAKWLGPYKRSTATSPSAAGAMPMPAAAAGMDVKCRAVGFFTPPPAAPAARIK
ncbi:unknown protein [Oryza sativa Japonica Group]|jgi:uncharacterized protein (TIGR01615 family)|uniref:Os01g0915000 protein n=4 Tax=Oryza TaxID=4527 RepID=A0A979HJJ1_ORYSJ|nr:uncharacterized protein LOC4324350 [Oryza sativa Japonica Group]KAB8084878.1 hypothetical protein EE612_007534 [Oryza sativa]KAF2953959.1 hypothetical protein DAI22_01g446100 [Oryza sativa Japonica Group]BAB92668.1 unknown protein [Oryza sativa Japonica Group]BAF07098.1 Os01g0915000 [Oryza sativa Japonica Group]BAG98220.1 unnamed protein product [Oryza sativa Japonica Group]|eukprot:NP_001045184.1 Os01g0915000 [Oryza sativa Japonica Group]